MKSLRLQTDLRTALLYALFGGLWILFSDRLLAALVSDSATLTQMEIYKGWFFVAASAMLIFFLLRRDLIIRQADEDELRRINRALTTISMCNQTLIRVTDENELLNEICRICVERGGYRMAWVGYAEQDERKTVRPVAYMGFEEGYLDSANITWADDEHGRGPTGTAIRTRQTCIARSIPEHPDYGPWRAAAIQRGYAASIALPLTVGEKTFGALNIYTAEPDAFDAEEVKLLKELAGDLAYGVEALRARAEHRRTEEAVRASEDRYRDLVEHIHDLVGTHDLQGNILSVNAAATRLLGIDRDALTGMNLRDILAPEVRKQFGDYLAAIQRDGKASGLMLVQTRGGEKRIWEYDNTLRTDFVGGPIVRAMARDITESKRAEEKIRQQIAYLTSLREIDRIIASAFDMHMSLNALLSRAVTLLAVDAADVLLVTPSMNTLEYAVGVGFRTDAAERIDLRLGEGYAGRAALEQRLIQIPNLETEANPLLSPVLLGAEKFVGYICLPLIVKGKAIGVLEVFQRSVVKRDQEWLDFLTSLAGQAAIAIDNASLFENLQRTNTELTLAYDATIEGWSRAMDLRDEETEGHTRRVVDMTIRMARAMDIPEREIIHMRYGAQLHDIGKLGVPDHVLLKKEGLTETEWTIMKQHPQFAYEMLRPIAYLHRSIDIPYCHHEKWDGSGYPRGLSGEQIPLAARIFAVVDVWDALTSDRPYRAAWPADKARAYIQSEAGRYFDPIVVEKFLTLITDQ